MPAPNGSRSVSKGHVFIFIIFLLNAPMTCPCEEWQARIIQARANERPRPRPKPKRKEKKGKELVAATTERLYSSIPLGGRIISWT
ncbi:hypothetical protein BC939DRAFT_467450 [Gamsiella multidivaricata]|uniref:uncharacterized protein n=1 Tax=Gamsiella multidivaricata TaxID=101098 RepID=UPI0022207FE0|nr:uncharacterized protein BC939DRAFT_467450 [Gamsiella multidivaricata]KAI7816944.1 hypothetical protein BC939DRAFT_467450 [Gamsiella multidivaricata]